MHCNGSSSSGRGRTRMRSMHPHKPQGSKLRHSEHTVHMEGKHVGFLALRNEKHRTPATDIPCPTLAVLGRSFQVDFGRASWSCWALTRKMTGKETIPKAYWPYVTIDDYSDFFPSSLCGLRSFPFYWTHDKCLWNARMAEIFVGAAVFFTIQINKSLSLYLRGYFQKGNACI